MPYSPNYHQGSSPRRPASLSKPSSSSASYFIPSTPISVASNALTHSFDSDSFEDLELGLQSSVFEALDSEDETTTALRTKLEQTQKTLSDFRTEVNEKLDYLIKKQKDKWYKKLGHTFDLIWTAIKSTARTIWEGKDKQGGLKKALGFIGEKIATLFKKVSEYVAPKLQAAADFCAVVADQVEYITKTTAALVTREVETLVGVKAVSGIIKAAWGQEAMDTLKVRGGKTPEEAIQDGFEEAIKKAKEGRRYNKDFIPVSLEEFNNPNAPQLKQARRYEMHGKLAQKVEGIQRNLQTAGAKIESAASTAVSSVTGLFQKKGQGHGTSPSK